MAKIMSTIPDKPVAIDEDISFKGLKNPIHLVIIGFSTRAILDAARKTGKQIMNVVIIEPDLEVFHQTLKREYIADIINDETVDIIAGIPVSELGWHLHKSFSTQNKKGHRLATAINPEVYVDAFVYQNEKGELLPVAKEITEIVYDAAKQVYLSLGCASDTFFRWEQTLRNIDNIKTSFQIKSLFNKFKDMPAIVVGGGPSVEDFITSHKKYDLNNRAIIIACDAALPRLLKEGIRPHLVTRCERKLSQIFSGVTKDQTKDVFYAAYPWTPPEFFDLFEDKIMLFRGNGICTWSGFQPGEVNGGVSAANAALEIAYLLGVKEIYTTGIDLCFIDDKSHVAGTEVEFDIEASKPKWFKIVNNEGAEVTTIPVWFRCLNEYNHAVLKHVDLKIPFYNTSIKGAKIEGTKVLGWDDAIKNLTQKFDVVALIRNNLTKHTPEFAKKFDERKSKTLGMLKSFGKDVEKLFLYLDDYMLTGIREEERCLNQLKVHSDPKEFFINVKSVQNSLAAVYMKGADQVDKFKDKYLGDIMFSLTVLDCCMTDFFQTENRLAGLKNVVGTEHERIKAHIALNMSLYRILQTYAGRLLNLLEGGAKGFKYDGLIDDCKPEESSIAAVTLEPKESKLILPSQYKKKTKKQKDLIIQ